MTQPRIALVGNLANVAYRTCKLLRRKGVQADVYVQESELRYAPSNPENEDPDILRNPPDWLKIVPEPSLPLGIWTHKPLTLAARGMRKIRRTMQKRLLIRALRRYDLLESFCLQPPFIQAIGRPYISFATGSDLRELAIENTPAGSRARSIFQHAELVFFAPDPGHLDAVRQLKLKNSYPYRQVIDTEFFAPKKKTETLSRTDELTIFHPTNLDWTQSNSRWNKRNDILFRGFSKLVKSGHRARLTYLERGPDVIPTRRLVTELGIENHVETQAGDLTRGQLQRLYTSFDVVADQFGGTNFGLIGLEAMSCGRPVLAEVNLETMNLCYDEAPPVLNCKNENDICEALKSSADETYRERIGDEARQWIMKYHDWQKVVNKLIWHFETVLGRRVL